MTPQSEREWRQVLAAAHPDRGGDPLTFQQTYEARAHWRASRRVCAWCSGPLPDISRTGHRHTPQKFCSAQCLRLSNAERRTVRHRRVGRTRAGGADTPVHQLFLQRGYRMKSGVLGLVVLLASVIGANAQTHPCDQAVATAGKVSSQITVQAEFCQPLVENIDAVTIYGNGTPVNLSTLQQVTPTANGAGLVAYRITLGQFAPGSYTLQISAWNKSVIDGSAVEGPKSSPFALTSVAPNPAPSAPKVVRIGG